MAMEETEQPDSPVEKRARRRVTAETMAAKQRDISVSEFFAKNRHLLGFDNPRKASSRQLRKPSTILWTPAKEAGIVPEIWVHIEATGANRYKVGVQDNGPGIVKKQIPLIFGKLLYGSKFHRLRMSRGQQGIGISAAGMYGMLTTGKPVKIISMTSPKKAGALFRDSRSTQNATCRRSSTAKATARRFRPAKRDSKYIADHGIEWVSHYPRTNSPIISANSKRHACDDRAGRALLSAGAAAWTSTWNRPRSPIHTSRFTTSTRMAARRPTSRSTTKLPPEPQEIKPHPYGIELGQLVTMLKDTEPGSMSQFLTTSFSRVSSGVAQKICETAKISTRANPKRIGRQEADAAIPSHSGNKDQRSRHGLHLSNRRSADSQGTAPPGPRRVFLRCDPSAGRLSRQSVSD